MKMLILSAMLIIAAPSFATETIAPNPVKTPAYNCFNFFRLHHQAKNVVLTWAASAPDVAQFIIERSYDGQYFDAIDQVNGNIATNKYKDTSVFPGYIYYRITAVKTDGSSETSSVEVIRIVQH